jgi:transposase InsO family protein
MQMNIQIGRRAEALDERDRTAVSLAALQSRLFDQKCGDDAVDALQQRREQFGMGSEQDARAGSETRAPIDAPAPAGSRSRPGGQRSAPCKPTAGVTMHSDRGSQYASTSHRRLIKDYRMVQCKRHLKAVFRLSR